MSSAAVDEILDRFSGAETVGEAEDALVALAALDARELTAAAEHEPIGDLYAELAMDLFDENVIDEAVRLQELALDQPCTNRWRELGTLLGYRWVGGEDDVSIAALASTKSGASTDAYLIGAFAEVIERDAPELALNLFDDALAIAKGSASAAGHRPGTTVDAAAAESSDDADDADALLASIQVPRALARQEAGQPADADDEAGFAALEAMNAQIRGEQAAEAHQLFVSREDIDDVVARWPDEAAEMELTDQDAYYAGLEQLWRVMPATGHTLHLHPIVVEQFDRAGAAPGRIVGDLPEAFAAELLRGDAARPWPPGRNDECWCGSGRKYKRCCGAA